MGHEQIDSYLRSFEIKEKMQLWLFIKYAKMQCQIISKTETVSP